MSCKVDREVDREYITELNLAGGLGGRGPERKEKARMSCCFTYVSYSSSDIRIHPPPVVVDASS